MRRQISFFAPVPYDATSMYRGLGPLLDLEKRHDIKITMTDASWMSIRNADVVLMQRPHDPKYRQVLYLARLFGKKVWVDYDDDLFSVPLGNPTYQTYADRNVQNTVTDMLVRADAVTVSTEALAEVARRVINRVKNSSGEKPEDAVLDPAKVVVIPNAYDYASYRSYREHGWAFRDPLQLILWRGSATHDRDLAVYSEAMASVASRAQGWSWNFVGSPFWQTIQKLSQAPGVSEKQVTVTPPIDPFDYMKFIWRIMPAIIIVPLEDIPFNRSKSNIAWIEGTHAGAVCLAPDWAEWNRPGVVTYRDERDFEAKLWDLVSGKYNLSAMRQESWSYIRENLSLERVNEKRMALIEKLLQT